VSLCHLKRVVGFCWSYILYLCAIALYMPLFILVISGGNNVAGTKHVLAPVMGRPHEQN
jgi:hypothetical protein